LTIPQSPLGTPDANEKVTAKPGIVVLDYYHVNQFQPSEIDALTEAVAKRGGRVELSNNDTALEMRLKYASAYVIISPSSPFSAEEIRVLQAFITRGGRLAIFTDATRGVLYYDYFSGATINYPDANIVNPLLAPYGININNDYLYDLSENEGNFRNVFFNDFGKDEMTFGLKQVAFYGTHSVAADSGVLLLEGAKSTRSSLNDAHNPAEGGAALSENGNVLAFGDFTFLTPPYNNVADNAALVGNIADFLLGGKRTQTLATFPYVFSQASLQVFPTSEVKMTAEMIAALSRLQASLNTINMSVQISQKEPKNGDMLILGTFTPSDDLSPFIENFGLVIEETGDYVEVPGFGEVGKYGNGILLFESGRNGNTLVLLSDTMENMIYLLDTVSSGSLSGCVLQGNIGVCSVGYGGDYSDDTTDETTDETTTDEAATEEPAAEEEGTAEATPTPGG
jgi:hypothetical protein